MELVFSSLPWSNFPWRGKSFSDQVFVRGKDLTVEEGSNSPVSCEEKHERKGSEARKQFFLPVIFWSKQTHPCRFRFSDCWDQLRSKEVSNWRGALISGLRGGIRQRKVSEVPRESRFFRVFLVLPFSSRSRKSTLPFVASPTHWRESGKEEIRDIAWTSRQ